MWSRKIIAVLAVLAAVCVYFYSPEKLIIRAPKLENGDVIFRRENSFWGDIATSIARRDGSYSHTGIILLQNGSPYVVHAYADAKTNNAQVSMQPLAEFLKNSSASAYFRLNFAPAIREEVAKQAFGYYQRKTPFDDKFSLDDDKAVYCTELVWAASKIASGYDIAPEKSLMMDRKYIGNDDLFLGGFMSPLK